MTTALAGVNVSPVNMDDRKTLGIKSGDTVRVHQKIVDEKGKTRIQVFEGMVLAVKHGTEPGATFTVRKVSSGIGVEKIFPLYSPAIDKIEIVKRISGKRSKLYYIREKVAREVKRQMRNLSQVSIASESSAEAAARAEAEAKEAEAKAAAEAEVKAAEEAKQAEAETAKVAEVSPTEESAPTEESKAEEQLAAEVETKEKKS